MFMKGQHFLSCRALRTLILIVASLTASLAAAQNWPSGGPGKIPVRHRSQPFFSIPGTSQFVLPKLAQSSSVQTQAGTNFWLAFPMIYALPGIFDADAWLHLTSEQGAVATVSIGGLGFSTTVNVPAGGETTILLPREAFVPYGEGTHSRAIHVVASQEISVYGVGDEDWASDAFTVWPTATLGKRYVVCGRDAGMNTSENVWQTTMAVVAVSSGTVVTIIPRGEVGTRPAGVPYEVTLNSGEVYQLSGDKGIEDVSGTIVTSNKPVAVFGGTSLSWIPWTSGTGNYLMEQQLPDHIAGTSFPIVPFAGRSTARYRCFALVDNTIVSINGSPITTLDRGGYEEFQWSTAGVVTSNNPVHLFQYANGQEFEHSAEYYGDPTLTTVVPFDRFLTRYVVSSPTPMGVVEDHYLNVIAPSDSLDNVFIDGQPVTGFIQIPTSLFSYAAVSVEPGPHIVESTKPIGVYAYGWGTFDAYSSPAGMNLTPARWNIDNLDLVPNPVAGSLSGVGTVTLDAPAGPEGIQVTLTSGDTNYCRVPATVTVQPGEFEGTFTYNTSLTNVERQVLVTASIGQSVKSKNLTIRPNAFVEFSAAPNPVLGGSISVGKVRLAVNATSSAVFTLSSSNTLAATVPSSVTISAGQSLKTFNITTKPVTVPQTSLIKATWGTETKEFVLQVLPVRITGFVINPSNTYESGVVTAQVTLNGPAPTGGTTVKLTQSNANAATIPASILVPAGQTSKTVNITCKPVTSAQTTIVTAAFGATSMTQQLSVAPITLQSLGFVTPAVTGGSTSTAVLTLPVKAPVGGIKVTLISGNTAAATVPSTVTVPQNAQSVNFVVTTKPVGSTTFVVITGKRNASTVTATLTVKPPELSAFAITPTTIKGGSKATGKLTLTGKAGPGGVTVYVQSNNSAATPPASIVVPANQTTASFQISTSVVSLNTMVQITARSSNVQKNAVLTVTR